MIAHALVVGWRAWLSLYSSTTTLAPRVAYLLLAADPLEQLGRRSFSGGESARVEGRKHRVQAWGGRLAAALVGGGDGALADGLGVAGWHAQAVATEGLAQRRPGGAQLGGGGVDAAELLGQGEGAFGFGPIGEEAAGLPAQGLRRDGDRRLPSDPLGQRPFEAGLPPLRRRAAIHPRAYPVCSMIGRDEHARWACSPR